MFVKGCRLLSHPPQTRIFTIIDWYLSVPLFLQFKPFFWRPFENALCQDDDFKTIDIHTQTHTHSLFHTHTHTYTQFLARSGFWVCVSDSSRIDRHSTVVLNGTLLGCWHWKQKAITITVKKWNHYLVTFIVLKAYWMLVYFLTFLLFVII